MSGQHHGMTVHTDFMVLLFVWALVVVYFVTAIVLMKWRDWRDRRRAQRMTVHTARGLGAQLIADEAAVKRGDFAARRSGRPA